MRIIIVGGGIIGLSIAWTLQQAGYFVTVYDNGQAGQASAAAAGVMVPTDDEEWLGEQGAFNQQALQHWPVFAEQLAAQTATSLDSLYRRTGLLYLRARTVDMQPRLQLAEAFGMDSEYVSDLDIPGLAPGDWHGVWMEQAIATNPAFIIDALRTCLLTGTVIRAEVQHLLTKGEETVGVALTDGQQQAADMVIWTTGAFPQPTGTNTPTIIPVTGEAFICRPEQQLPYMLRIPGGPLVPRPDGTCWAGTTVHHQAHQPGGTADSIRELRRNISQFFPHLLDNVDQTVWGWRPYSPDGLAFIGPHSPGLMLATGHGRGGVIQAPITASLILHCLQDASFQVPSDVAANRSINTV